MRTGALVLLVALAAVGCTTQSTFNTIPVGPAADSETPPASSGVSWELVGEWHAEHECAKIVDLFRRANNVAAGVQNVVGNGLIPGVTSASQLADPANPCQDAVPRDHAHVFTPNGEFRSLDFDGNQVDDGLYEVIDDDTMTINGVEFTFHVIGDTLTLDRPIPDCAATPCGFEENWGLMVAMPGTTWQRHD